MIDDEQPLVIQPSPTVWAFMESDAFLPILEGPRGEGKTHGGYFRLLHKASQIGGSYLPLKVATIRDTWVNLKRTSIANLEELQRNGLKVRWLEDKTEAILQDGLVHIYFMGMDRMEEINKLQGLGVGVVWAEEPAPAADISGGLPLEVFAVGATSLRQQGVQCWFQITMNPPDIDHWTQSLPAALAELAEALPVRRAAVKVYRIPKGENKHYSEERRLENRLALEAAGRHDLVARLVEGQAGQVVLGEPVVPEYSDTAHVAPELLPILPDMPLIRLWDFGLTPTCLWTQITPRGYWHLLWAVQGFNMGVEQLIETQVKPWEAIFCARHRGGFKDIGDPAGCTPDQSDSEVTAALTIEELLQTTFEPGPQLWNDRLPSLRLVFNRTIRGRPMVQVDPDNTLVRRCLRGGWRYPKNGLGLVTPTVEAAKRVSGLHDHVGHALTYGAGYLWPSTEVLARRLKEMRRPGRPAPRQALGWMGA